MSEPKVYCHLCCRLVPMSYITWETKVNQYCAECELASKENELQAILNRIDFLKQLKEQYTHE
jgi:hypothetical protein